MPFVEILSDKKTVSLHIRISQVYNGLLTTDTLPPRKTPTDQLFL